MGALLALASALGYGMSDVVGGLVARRLPFARVALLGQVGGLVAMCAAAPLVSPAPPSVADLLWGGLSGVGTGTAMVFLFRGMSRGAMSVVVPVSAVGGVALPVLVSTAVLGDRPSLLAWTGIAVVGPALWWVSRGPRASRRATSAAVTDGLLSSVGIAVQYLALARSGPAAGIWPVAAGRVAAVVVVVILIAVLASDSRPDADRGRSLRSGGGAVVAGVLAALALVCYLLATRTELVTVAVVLSSLYPVVPVLFGVTALHERLDGRQAAGLAAALGASVLIAMT